MSTFTIYMPSVYANITESMISKTFHRMNIGKVKHVELIGTTGKGNRAHVFFSEMYDTEESRVVQENVNANKSSKLSYAKNEHVFWIMLNSRRVYDGSSNAGEYVEQVAVEFTEEELDFMDAHNPIVDTSLVDVAYVESIENELYNSRNALAELQMNNQLLFNEYNRLLASYSRTEDMVDKWVHLAENNQMARLKRGLCGEAETYPVDTVECVDMDTEFEGYDYDETNANTSEMTLKEIAV
jgi:hypothetical protein